MMVVPDTVKTWTYGLLSDAFIYVMRHLRVSTLATEHFHDVVPLASILCSLPTVMVVPEIVNATHAIAPDAHLLYIAIHVLVSI